MNKTTRRALIIAAKVLACTVIIIAILLIGIRIGEKFVYANFYSNAKSEMKIPALSQGFVPQGLDYVEEEKTFLTCGYSAKKGQPSMVCAMRADGTTVVTKLKKADGANYTGHTGGIAHYAEFCYITGARGCDVFLLSDVLKGGEAKQVGEVRSPEGHDPAFVTVAGGALYEGSFYRAGNYETPDNERITTPCGDKNTSMIYAYKLDASAPFCVSEQPFAAYSATGLVQGMTFTESGEMVLSTSYGLASSHLLYYTIPQPEEGKNGLKWQYYLDSDSLVASVTAPPMSEEIVCLDGRIYIMTESASDKYIFGKFMSGRSMFSYKRPN